MPEPRHPRSLTEHFSALDYPREGWRVLYPLRELLLVVLCATLAGMEDFVEIKPWGDQRWDFLCRFYPYGRGVPSHDTLNDVINAIGPQVFKACFMAWVEVRRHVVCHDIDWMLSDRRYAGEPRFPHLACLNEDYLQNLIAQN